MEEKVVIKSEHPNTAKLVMWCFILPVVFFALLILVYAANIDGARVTE